MPSAFNLQGSSLIFKHSLELYRAWKRSVFEAPSSPRFQGWSVGNAIPGQVHLGFRDKTDSDPPKPEALQP